ncbi:MAG TPA: non-canonical purine NTP pyrophosphatase [Candidatus Limnocylindrales bacterium]|nr:non-canonical purine NTP pyrophosphatase [Candidatus Limnocylindrales bacterium]
MTTITFVTGSNNKVAEAKAILPFTIKNKQIDLDEIQTLDAEQVVHHKLHQAFRIVGGPVMVDDVSAELESLNGLPGPFIKFFEQKLGQDALYKLVKTKNDRVKITCHLGYCDGQKEIIVKGVLYGTVVSPRGENGWGFDKVVMPDGQTRTMAEMSPEEKNNISHRYLALKLLAEKLHP